MAVLCCADGGPGALTGPGLQIPPDPPPQRERFMTLVKYSLGLCTFLLQDPGSHGLSNSEASAKQSAMTCKEHAAVTQVPRGSAGCNDPVALSAQPLGAQTEFSCYVKLGAGVGGGGRGVHDASGAS